MTTVYIVILNWNGWQDTIECLESVFRLKYEKFKVVVCDNGSSDGSIHRLGDWAEGRINAEAKNQSFARLTSPPNPKPVCYRTVLSSDPFLMPANNSLTIIEIGENVGFAAGCNIGLKFALQDDDCEYVWLLNNDTVVEPDALLQLVNKMEEDRRVGICGSLICSYYHSEMVQAHGGTRYNRWMARTPASRPRPQENSKSSLDCVLGCSMLVSRKFLKTVGLMEESYFLYFEELDWAVRSRGRFHLGYAHRSKVYHKEGASIGSSGNRGKRSLLSERYLSRNRVLFTKRFYPLLLPSVLFFVAASALCCLMRKDAKRAKLILSSAHEGLVCPIASIKPCL